ncbi:MAG TPA: hypothetical protein VH373_09945 [Jatrophihabitantaceae bacterium]
MTSAEVAGVLDRASAELTGLMPLARRVAALDPKGVLRIRLDVDVLSGYARLPFGVLVGRTVRVSWSAPPVDCAVRAGDLVSWLDDHTGQPPVRRDVEWRGALPPVTGWRRIERVPAAVVRDVVRKGAITFREAAERDGIQLGRRGVQPRAEVADALLDSVVLTAIDGSARAEVTLRTVSALTRMGFLPDGSHVAIDVCGRWARVAAEYGSVYAERPGLALGIVS